MPEPSPQRLAALLGGLGITPNRVSGAGLLFALAAAVCLARGAGHTLPCEARGVPASLWPVWAGLFLGLSALADVCDGALARSGRVASPFGALLDSTLDRFGDAALALGCVVYFAAQGNATFGGIAGLALVASVQVSYVKARGENLVARLDVGFWQRAERVVALLVGAFLGRIPAALCVLALLPLLTVARRTQEARRQLAGRGPAATSRAPWRQRRGAPGYLATCATLAAAIYLLPALDPFFLGARDPVGDWLRAAGR